MEKVSTICFLLLLLTIASVVNGAPNVCYLVLRNTPCEGEDMGKVCLPECMKRCGASVVASCPPAPEIPWGNQPPGKPTCACETIVNGACNTGPC